MAKRTGTREQTIQWPKEQGQEDKLCNGQKNKDKRTHNTMAKRTRTREQTIQWPKEQGQDDKQYNGQKNKDKRTNNTMAKRTRTRGQTIQWPKEQGQENKQLVLLAIVLYVILSMFFWPLYCLSSCPCSFGHCIVCPSSMNSSWLLL
jgi:hypothetical protein